MTQAEIFSVFKKTPYKMPDINFEYMNYSLSNFTLFSVLLIYIHIICGVACHSEVKIFHNKLHRFTCFLYILRVYFKRNILQNDLIRLHRAYYFRFCSNFIYFLFFLLFFILWFILSTKPLHSSFKIHFVDPWFKITQVRVLRDHKLLNDFKTH